MTTVEDLRQLLAQLPGSQKVYLQPMAKDKERPLEAIHLNAGGKVVLTSRKAAETQRTRRRRL